MLQSHKVLINTISLYIKIIANSIVILFSTRIALEELGVDSFGLYNLIAGVIALLSFLTGALTVSSQRFMSIALGENDEVKLNRVFNVSLLVHFLLSLLIIILFKIIQPFLFDGFLNIESKDIENAIRIYDIMIVSSALTIFAIPYNAAINAREEMWFSSITDIISILLKLFAAIMLLYIVDNKLVVYTFLMLNAIVVGSLINIIWCRLRYKECKISFDKNIYDYILFKDMFSFAGWNTLGSLAVVMRNQGVAVVLNIFFGTFINAAYGVANQLNSLVITFASTLTTVFTPMIIKAKGAKDDAKMLFISIFSSKLSFFLSSLIAIPVLIDTDFILNHWLDKVPEDTISFSRNIIFTFLIMQLYPGITRAIYATGQIKWYQITISILLVLNIPIGYLMFSFGLPAVYILYTMIGSQFLTLLATIYYGKKLINLNLKDFIISSVFKPVTIFLIIYGIGVLGYDSLMTKQYIRFVLMSFVLALFYMISFYLIIFNIREKQLLINLFKSLKSKIFKK